MSELTLIAIGIAISIAVNVATLGYMLGSLRAEIKNNGKSIVRGEGRLERSTGVLHAKIEGEERSCEGRHSRLRDSVAKNTGNIIRVHAGEAPE
jgi:hypothetical protein